MTDAPFAGLLESAPDAMIVVGPDGNIVMVNGHAESLFGHDRAALIGASVEIPIPGAYHADHRAHIEAYFKHPETRPMGRNMALTGKTRDGREFPVEISLGPMTTESGILVLAAVRDVTAKRHAKAETLAAKDKAATAGDQLRDAIESIAEGFVLYNSVGRLVLCNSAFRGFYGYSEADAKPGFATHKSLCRLDELRDADSRKRRSFRESLAELRRSGTQRITETVGDRVIESRQQITAEGGIISVQSDITDRIRAEQALQGRIMFSDLLHRITVAANQATSVEEVMQFCLDEICAVTGWPVGHVYMVAGDGSGEVVSSGLWHIEALSQNAAIKRATRKTPFIPRKGLISRVLTSSKPDWNADVSKDPRFRRGRSAKIIGVMASFVFPVLTGKKIAALFEFFSNQAVEPNWHMLETMAQIGTQLGRVIERHAAQQALRESEERLRFVMDHSPAAVNLKDMEGRYILVNARFEEWYGLAAEDVIGKRGDEVFPLLQTAPFASLENEVARQNVPVEREFEIDFADGRKHLVLGSKFPVNDGQGVAMGIGTIEIDITEPRQVETQLRQAHKMEAVGELTGGVAHDFNNLLAVISGNLELLDEALAGDENKRELLRWAMDAADDAASLTRDLLAFSRQQPLSPRTVRINDLVNNLLTMMRRPLGEVIDVATDLCDGIWLTTVDPAQFENAVLNLVLNARDAMPDGGVVTITTANVSLKETDIRHDTAAGDYVKLSVSDTGHGLSRAVLERAFEPFFTTKEVGRGSGLGLSMVYGFSKQSGGHAEIESVEGQGATVSIYLPRGSEGQPMPPAPVEPVMPPGKGETILVVEDEDRVRDLAVRLVRSLGYEVREAPDAKAAREILEGDKPIDLLLTDVVLPGGVSGLDLAAQAIAKHPALAVIYVSGYSAAIEAGDSIEQGAVRLAKPYRGKALASAIRRALGDDGQPDGS